MNKTMKAAVVHEFGKPLVIEQVPVPVPGDGQILVKVEACGVCHTDLHAADGDWPVKPNPPFIPGHEGVGYVVGRSKCQTYQGGRQGRCALVVLGMRPLRVLSRCLGNLVPPAAKYRIFRQWEFCRICRG